VPRYFIRGFADWAGRFNQEREGLEHGASRRDFVGTCNFRKPTLLGRGDPDLRQGMSKSAGMPRMWMPRWDRV
jgi:hypothetical protein